MAAFLIPLLAFLLACGPGEEPTATPTKAPAAAPTATSVPAAAPTATSVPGAEPAATSAAVAVPTATSAPVPTDWHDNPKWAGAKRGGGVEQAQTLIAPFFDPQLLTIVNRHYEGNGKLYLNLFINYEGRVVECELCSDKGWWYENSNKTLVFDLRPGIKFHSGSELTSADVAYSIRMIMGEIDGIVSQRAGFLNKYVESVETPSDYTMKIHLFQPAPIVPKLLSVSPAAIYQDGTTRADLKIAPAGAGAFIVDEITPGSSWKLVRNPNYFKEGQPYLDWWNHLQIPDKNSITAAFLTHKIPWAAIPGKAFESQLVKLEDSGDIQRIVELGGCGQWFVGYNTSAPPFNDVKVRQGVNLIFDRTLIGAVHGAGNILPPVPSVMFEHPGQPYATPLDEIWDTIPGWGTGANKVKEIEEGKKLLADAGYPSGFEVELMATAPLSASMAAEEMQAQLNAAGLKVTIDPHPSNIYVQKLTNLDYKMNTYGNCTVLREPDDYAAYFVTGGSRNLRAFSNAEVDRLFVEMSAEVDPVRARELFFEIQHIIVYEQIPWSTLMSTDGLYWAWNNFHGWGVGIAIGVSSGMHRGDRLWVD